MQALKILFVENFLGCLLDIFSWNMFSAVLEIKPMDKKPRSSCLSAGVVV